MKKTLFIVIAAIAVLAACKKDKQQTTGEKMLGKWQLVSVFSEGKVLGTTYKDTTTGSSGDYIEFRNDGKVYASVQGESDTSAYAVLDESRFVIEKSDTAQIKTLTSSAFTYVIDEQWEEGYSKSTVNLKR